MIFVWQLELTKKLLLPLIVMTFSLSKFNIAFNTTNIITSTTSVQSNQNKLRITPKFFEEMCTCLTQWQCKCCAKVNNDLLNVHQTLCADWTVFSNSSIVKANVGLNDNILYTNTFSVWNIPPFCFPIMPAIALTGCIQIHSITHHEYNTLHGCANATINFITFNLINWQIVCMDIGGGGIEIVEPNHEFATTTTTEKLPEIELETSDLIKNSTNKVSLELNEVIPYPPSSTVLKGLIKNYKRSNAS